MMLSNGEQRKIDILSGARHITTAVSAVKRYLLKN